MEEYKEFKAHVFTPEGLFLFTKHLNSYNEALRWAEDTGRGGHWDGNTFICPAKIGSITIVKS